MAASKADQKSKVEKPKRVRKSKVRTSISTTAEETVKSSPKKAAKQQSATIANQSNLILTAPITRPELGTAITPAQASSGPSTGPPPQAVAQAPPDFSSWYLRTVTHEFGEDIDKIRQAQDFKASSLNVLIHALQQGEACFSDREKRGWEESVAARSLVELAQS